MGQRVRRGNDQNYWLLTGSLLGVECSLRNYPLGNDLFKKKVEQTLNCRLGSM